MRYLRLFENYNSLEYPDVFGDSLLRGVKIEKDEYIDDPKLRKVSVGSSDGEDYVYFLKNFKNLGLQDPTKSVHFYLNPTQEQKSMIGYYGKSFKPIPEKNAKFSFNKELRNGGLGSTWWYPGSLDTSLSITSSASIFTCSKLYPKQDLASLFNIIIFNIVIFILIRAIKIN